LSRTKPTAVACISPPPSSARGVRMIQRGRDDTAPVGPTKARTIDDVSLLFRRHTGSALPAGGGADAAPTARSGSSPGAARPLPPGGARNVVVVVFDSLRYDAAMAAGMPNMARLGPVEQRWSYASWTAPSHYNLLMG